MSEESKKRFFSEITKAEELDNGVVSLAIRPNQPSNYGQGSLSGKQLQERFDRLAGLIIERYNEMASGLSSDEALEYFKLPKVDGKQITLGTGEDAKVDLSSFIKKISDKAGDLVVETPYENSTVTTIKSILAQIYTDLQDIYADYATNAALQQHSSDKDADNNDVTDTHPSIRRLIPDKIDEHNISTVAHEDIRKKIDTDIALHSSDKDADGNVVTTTHPEIRKEIDNDIDVHNKATGTHKDIRDKIDTDIDRHNISTDAHSDIRALINGITGADGRLTELEKVVNSFLNDAVDSDNAIENLKEIIAYIELNRSKIDDIIKVDGLLSQKIDKTSIVTNIPTDDDTDTDTKVLAASVGKTIKNELDKRVLIVDGDPVVRVSGLQGYAVESDQNPIVRANTLKDYAQTTTNDGTVVRETNEIPVARKSDLSVYALETENGATVVRETNNTLVARKSDLDDFVKDSNDNPIVRGGNIGSYLTDYAKETNDNNETIVRQTSDTPVARLSDILTITDIEDAGFFKENSQDPVVTQNGLADYAKTTTTDGGTVVRTNDLNSTLGSYALSSDLEGYAPLVDKFARNVAYDNPEDPFITTAVLDSRLENIVVGGGGGDIAVDGDTLGDNEDGAVEVQAVRCAHNEDEEYEDRQFLKFFVGTKDEYDSLNDKSGVLAIIKEQGMPTSAEIKEAVQYLTNIRNGTAVQRAIADENGNTFEGSYLKKTDASNTYATQTSLGNYATTASLSAYAKETNDSGATIVRETGETKVARISDIDKIKSGTIYAYTNPAEIKVGTNGLRQYMIKLSNDDDDIKVSPDKILSVSGDIKVKSMVGSGTYINFNIVLNNTVMGSGEPKAFHWAFYQATSGTNKIAIIDGTVNLFYDNKDTYLVFDNVKTYCNTLESGMEETTNSSLGEAISNVKNVTTIMFNK